MGTEQLRDLKFSNLDHKSLLQCCYIEWTDGEEAIKEGIEARLAMGAEQDSRPLVSSADACAVVHPLRPQRREGAVQVQGLMLEAPRRARGVRLLCVLGHQQGKTMGSW